MPDKTLPSGVAIVDTNEATGLVHNLKIDVGLLDRARRGDFVRVLIKFKQPALPGVPAGKNPVTQPAIPDKPENPRATEFATLVVANRTPQGLLKGRVVSRPAWSRYHSIAYGDDLTIADRYVISHEQSTPATAQEMEPLLTGVIPDAAPINADDAKLRDAAKNLPPLAPNPQQQYWLRNGLLVTVYMFHAGVWVGAGNDGSNYEWTATGAHAGGVRDLDIVKDPRASEVLR